MLKKSLTAATLTLLMSQAAGAATVSYTSGTFNAQFNLYMEGLTPDTQYSSNPATVTGLQQFNPALGTLTGVTFTISQGLFELQAALDGVPSTGEVFEASAGATVQADLAYDTGTSGAVLAGIVNGFDLYCVGNEAAGDLCEDFSYPSLDFATDSFVLSQSLTDFNLTDIVGAGDVNNLRLDINLIDEYFDVAGGFEYINVDATADIFDATVMVTYEYSVVPVPAAVWLFGSGLLGLVGVARRKQSVMKAA